MVRIKTYGLKEITDKATRKQVQQRVAILKRTMVPHLEEIFSHETTPRIFIGEDLQPRLAGNIPQALLKKIGC